MRTILISILLILGTSLYAKEYSIEDRIEDMHDMAYAMNIIQSGFFYNNYDTIAEGVERLTDAVNRVQPPLEEVSEEDTMTKYMNNKTRMTRKIAKKINQKSLNILQRYKQGDAAQAIQAYTKILGQCIKCHREIRNW